MRTSMIVILLIAEIVWSQRVTSYVIVNRNGVSSDAIPPSFGMREFVDKYERLLPIPEQDKAFNKPYDKKLLQLYYLLQVVRSYGRPARQESAAIPRGPFRQLTREELRDELESLLVGVDGFEEIFNIGQYPDEPDSLKEQLANDFRLLFPLVTRTLGELRDAGTVGVELGEALQSKIREALADFRTMLTSMVELGSDVFGEMERTKKVPMMRGVIQDEESNPKALEEIIYVTEIPAASKKDVVDGYTLEVEKIERFLPSGHDAKYELSVMSVESLDHLEGKNDEKDNRTEVIVLTQDANLENDSDTPTTGEAHLSKAVSLEDPEMIALIPVVIEQLSLGNVIPAEEETLAVIFDQLWPLMVTEAERLRAKSSE